VLRTNNGVSFVLEFDKFCKIMDIEINKTTPYTPQVEWSCRMI
jgi:hypothetical protein